MGVDTTDKVISQNSIGFLPPNKNTINLCVIKKSSCFLIMCSHETLQDIS